VISRNGNRVRGRMLPRFGAVAYRVPGLVRRSARNAAKADEPISDRKRTRYLHVELSGLSPFSDISADVRGGEILPLPAELQPEMVQHHLRG